MEQRLSLITLGVANLQRSISFYVGLGWHRAMATAEGVAFFQLGGMGLSLFPFEDLAQDADLPCDPLPIFRGIALAHNVRRREDVDSVVEHMTRLGGTVQKAPEDKPWGGYGAYVSDPDGHLWEIAWNPGFPISDSGDILIPD